MEWILLLGIVIVGFVLFSSNNRMRGDVDRMLQENQIHAANLTRLEKLYEALLAARHASQPPEAQTKTSQPAAPLEATQPSSAAPAAGPASAELPPDVPPAEPPSDDIPPPEEDLGGDIPPRSGAAATEPVLPPTKKRFEWERVIGVQLPIWIGALALAVAGYFFVSYAIESGFFTPEFRVLAALLAGFGFLGGAEFIRRRGVTNSANIASALASAAIATFYATAFIASVVYSIIPETAGFIAMAVVTAFAITIAFTYGQSVAIIGMLGGYLTPVLFGSDRPSIALLFGYLALLHVATFAVIRLKDWWHLSLVALIGPAIWTVLWTQFAEIGSEPLPPIVFLILLPAVVAAASAPFWRSNDIPVMLFATKIAWIGRALPATVALASLGFLSAIDATHHSLPVWQGLIVLSLLTAAGSFARPVSLGFLIFYPFAVTVLALLSWRSADPGAITMMTAVSAVIFVFTALDQFRRLQRPFLWAVTLDVFAVCFFLVALFKVAGWETALAQKHFWAASALAIATAMMGLLWKFGPLVTDETERTRVYAVLAAAVTTFVSLAVVLELDPVLFPAASAIAVLGLAAVHSRVPVPGLRIVAAVYAVAYGLLVVGAGGGVSVPGSGLENVLAKSVEDAPWVLLILPGLAFLGASTLFRRNAPATPIDILSECLDVAAIVMLAIGIVFVMDADALSRRTIDVFITAAKVVPFEALLAAASVWLGRTIPGRRAIYVAGLSLAGVLGLAMLLILIAPVYMLWPRFNIPAYGPFSVALLALGLPSIIYLGIGWFVRQDPDLRYANYGRALSVFAVGALFTLMLLEIRRSFHPMLLRGTMDSTESYTYSAGMLIFGIALLVIGVVIQNRGARALSLIFVLAATLKVFLIDASSLEGLWRVLSFLGLGLSFLGISWGYARYVFGIGLGRQKPPDPPAAAADSVPSAS